MLAACHLIVLGFQDYFQFRPVTPSFEELCAFKETSIYYFGYRSPLFGYTKDEFISIIVTSISPTTCLVFHFLQRNSSNVYHRTHLSSYLIQFSQRIQIQPQDLFERIILQIPENRKIHIKIPVIFTKRRR